MDTQHADLVAQVKAELEAAGVNLIGPCGAANITFRVAYRLRAEGAGLLEKTSGNNCQDRAVDIVIYKDGTAYDMLGASGDAGGNHPQWNRTPDSPLDPNRWRPAPDPGDTPPPDDPDNPPDPPSGDLSALLKEFREFRTEVRGGFAQVADVAEALQADVRELVARPAPDYSGTQVAVGKKQTLKAKV